MEPYSIQDRTFQFSLQIIRFVGSLPKTTVSFVIGKQLLRSATSVGANIVEAGGGASKRDFLQFMRIARKSAYETSYWLRLLAECTPRNLCIRDLINESVQITKILTTIILNTKQNQTDS